jgi:predicted transcriptional regulator
MTNRRRRIPPPELLRLIARCEERHPGDRGKQEEWLLQILSYGITRKLLSPADLETLRKDADKWPESIRELLAERVAV